MLRVPFESVFSKVFRGIKQLQTSDGIHASAIYSIFNYPMKKADVQFITTQALQLYVFQGTSKTNL